MRLLTVVLAIILGTACARHDYTEVRSDGVSRPIRVDRVTGKTEALTRDGWVEVRAKAKPAPVPSSAPCTAEEVRQAHEPPSEYDRYLPERIKQRMKACASVSRQ